MMTWLRHGFRAFVTACGLVALAASSRAEIDPKYYREWQLGAPETLVLRVTAVKPTVKTERRGRVTLTLTHVEAEAAVEKVERTATGLKPGDVIRIQYDIRESDPPMVGGRELPLLKRGESYPAFLQTVTKGLYAPAAKGASFEPLIDA